VAGLECKARAAGVVGRALGVTGRAEGVVGRADGVVGRDDVVGIGGIAGITAVGD
jgi:hypothetical protein